VRSRCRYLVIAIFVFACSTASAVAGFDSAVSAHVDRGETSYVVDRCGGLSIAILGISESYPEVYNSMMEQVELFALLSSKIYSDEHGFSFEAAKTRSLDAFEKFSVSYADHFNNSYVRSGNYLDDAIVHTDLQVCSELRKAIIE
jgi:hypothetical protein